MSKYSKINRRKFLKFSAVAAGSAILVACGGGAPGATPTTGASPAPGGSSTPAASAGMSPSPSPAASPTSAASPAPSPTSAAASPTPAMEQTPAASPTSAGQAGGNITAQIAPMAPEIKPSGQPTGGEFHGAWPYQMPPTGHWNTFATNNNSFGIYWDMLEMPLGFYLWDKNQYVPLLAVSWEIIPPDTFQVKLRQGVKWSDGSQFTSKDVVTTFTLLRLQDAVVWNYLGSIDAPDDYTVVFKMKDPSTVVPRYILREHIRANSVYGEFAQKAKAMFDKGATTSSADMKKLRTQFEGFRPKELVVSGPYKVQPGSMTESQVTLVKVPDAWNANMVNFDKIVLYNGETPTVTPILLSKQIDYATHGFPPATEKALQQAGFRIIRPPVYSGPALFFNYKRLNEFSDPKVRQAIAMAVNMDQNATVSLGESAKRCKYMAGVSDSILEKWVPQSELSKLNSYAYDPDKAAQVLQSAGFKKQGDTWVTPNGKRMEYELGVPAEYADWSAAAQNLADQLTKFGIKTTVRPVTFTQWSTQMDAGRFQLGINAWGAGNPHPHFSYVADLLTHNAPLASGGGMNYPLKQKTQSVGEVDLQKLTIQAASGLNIDRQKEVITTLAKAFNELLPIIPLWERYGNNPALENVRVTGWLPENDPIYANSPYSDNFVTYMILNGTLKGVSR
ncbi:extracellular solute-binding protein family 5 [Thermobaculum terrenum ATCC BAA-798]|uniref:Extracellular solute-binding protein family 5 n=1 Tax=Thermobaculum terrenum (strain ATCC BAA-798 / CCMEE 7001 / YNP1) TaxID=525904 RepID=D1CFW2_THET1|nr:ABC transporter substrate-binding protein [Thermobaculum terrenum]ACZ41818.1 extracellular solute-binding protein family 5 [Thermobaculum terrenum ATCC BAA-798]